MIYKRSPFHHKLQLRSLLCRLQYKRGDKHWQYSTSQVFEGYGQTECTAGSSMTLPGDFTPGHVGPPLPCNYVKLVDVPDMNYFAENNQGEVRGRGRGRGNHVEGSLVAIPIVVSTGRTHTSCYEFSGFVDTSRVYLICPMHRCVSRVQMYSRDILRTLRRLLKHSTARDGCTRVTLGSGCPTAHSRSLTERSTSLNWHR